jgi:protein-S-isoprenylcysteine O-methyltransferase Ste14
MRTSTAAAGSSLFFACAPGVVAGVVPWWLTEGWEPSPVPFAAAAVGALVVAACAAVLLHAFARFVREGVGTPAPVAPTSHLVVGGLYRYVRNPMYVAVVGAVVGQALLLGRFGLLLYAALLQAIFVAFVRGYEEPALRRRFGPDYDAYRAAVPGWWPRARPARLPRETS